MLYLIEYWSPKIWESLHSGFIHTATFLESAFYDRLIADNTEIVLWLSWGSVAFNYCHFAVLGPKYALLIRHSCTNANFKSCSSHWASRRCPKSLGMKRQVWLSVSAQLYQTGRGCCVPRTLGPLAHPQANGCFCETTESALWQWGQLWRDPLTQCLPLFIYSQ